MKKIYILLRIGPPLKVRVLAAYSSQKEAKEALNSIANDFIMEVKDGKATTGFVSTDYGVTKSDTAVYIYDPFGSEYRTFQLQDIHFI